MWPPKQNYYGKTVPEETKDSVRPFGREADLSLEEKLIMEANILKRIKLTSMMVENHEKDEFSRQNLIRKHETWEDFVKDSRKPRKYSFDCRDVLNSITEEKNPMCDEFGRDGISVSVFFQWKGQNFLQNLLTLQPQVKAIQKDGVKLRVARVGDGADWRLQIWETHGGLRRHKVMNQELVVRGDVMLLETN